MELTPALAKTKHQRWAIEKKNLRGWQWKKKSFQHWQWREENLQHWQWGGKSLQHWQWKKKPPRLAMARENLLNLCMSVTESLMAHHTSVFSGRADAIKHLLLAVFFEPLAFNSQQYL